MNEALYYILVIVSISFMPYAFTVFYVSIGTTEHIKRFISKVLFHSYYVIIISLCSYIIYIEPELRTVPVPYFFMYLMATNYMVLGFLILRQSLPERIQSIEEGLEEEIKVKYPKFYDNSKKKSFHDFLQVSVNEYITLKEMLTYCLHKELFFEMIELHEWKELTKHRKKYLKKIKEVKKAYEKRGYLLSIHEL